MKLPTSKQLADLIAQEIFHNPIFELSSDETVRVFSAASDILSLVVKLNKKKKKS